MSSVFPIHVRPVTSATGLAPTVRHTYKTAAQVLGVTRWTVAFHVRKVYAKLEVHSKAEAVAKAVRGGRVR